jgi:phosphotriesterase-related protein
MFRPHVFGRTVTTVLALGAIFAVGLAGPTPAQRAAAPVIPNLAGKVLTVTGPIEPSALGQTLMHEHIFIDFKAPPPMLPLVTGVSVLKAPQATAPGGKGGGGLTDYDESLAEVMEFKKIGGGTIVDVTNFGLTRDPDALARISKASGLLVVMGAGWYQKALHPPDMTERTVDELTDIVVRDVTVGAQGTNIRSGIIGEVGVQGKPLIDNELKSVRASARAARITGAPMTLHSFASPDEMLRVLDIIASEGVDLPRVVMGHSGSGDTAYLKRLFERGVFVEWDYMGQAPLPVERDEQRAQGIADAIKAGYTGQILMAHDVCTKAQLKKNGGGGYAYIAERILPALKAKGITDADIQKILVDNPRRVLTFVAPQPAVPASAKP